MIKNQAGQKVGAQMVAAADGASFAGSVTVLVTGDAGTQATGSVGAGACTNEGNGYYTYAPAQAETNYDLIAFTFIGTGAVPQTVQVFTRAAAPDVNVTQFGGTAGTFASGIPEAKVASIAANAITTAAINDGAFTAAKFADAFLTAAKFASGAFDAVWSVATRVLTAATNLTTALATPTNITAGTITTVSGNVNGSVGSVASFGTLVADVATAVWGAATRTLSAFGFSVTVGTNSDKTGYALTSGYDPAKTAAQAGDAMTLTAAYDAAKTAASAADVASAINTYDAPTKAELDAAVAPLATAVGVATRASQTSVDDLPTNSELANALALSDDAVLAAIAALAVPTAADNAAALLDLSNGVEVGLTPRQALRLMVAAEAGKLSGAATTTIVIRNAVADSKNRISATVDTNGNRSAITYDLS